jgi:hypothetical protein
MTDTKKKWDLEDVRRFAIIYGACVPTQAVLLHYEQWGDILNNKDVFAWASWFANRNPELDSVNQEYLAALQAAEGEFQTKIAPLLDARSRARCGIITYYYRLRPLLREAPDDDDLYIEALNHVESMYTAAIKTYVATHRAAVAKARGELVNAVAAYLGLDEKPGQTLAKIIADGNLMAHLIIEED